MTPTAQVGIDFMKLKPSKGYNYVILAIDYFTKYVKMGALKEKTAECIATFLPHFLPLWCD